MPKVYVISNNGFDFEPAKGFGELVFLTSGFVDVNKNFDSYREKFENILKDFNIVEDYLLLVGVNLLCVLAYSIIYNPDIEVKLLHWNPKTEKYVQYTL